MVELWTYVCWRECFLLGLLFGILHNVHYSICCGVLGLCTALFHFTFIYREYIYICISVYHINWTQERAPRTTFSPVLCMWKAWSWGFVCVYSDGTGRHLHSIPVCRGWTAAPSLLHPSARMEQGAIFTPSQCCRWGGTTLYQPLVSRNRWQVIPTCFFNVCPF